MTMEPVTKRDVVALILYDREGNILLQHRTKGIAVLPDYWAFFGGGIEAGETPADALRRESLEELNYVPQQPSLLLTKELDVPGANIVGRLDVYVEAFLDDKSALKLGEGQGWGWFETEATRSLKMIEQDRAIISYLKNKYKGAIK